MTLPITLPINDGLLINPTFEQLQQTPIGEWQRVFASEEIASYFHIRGTHCIVALEPRPDYCDRGAWLAKLVVLDPVNLTVDYHDGWSPGRYYFDKVRGLLEVEAWLRARKQLQTLSEESTDE